MTFWGLFLYNNNKRIYCRDEAQNCLESRNLLFRWLMEERAAWRFIKMKSSSVANEFLEGRSKKMGSPANATALMVKIDSKDIKVKLPLACKFVFQGIVYLRVAAATTKQQAGPIRQVIIRSSSCSAWWLSNQPPRQNCRKEKEKKSQTSNTPRDDVCVCVYVHVCILYYKKQNTV